MASESVKKIRYARRYCPRCQRVLKRADHKLANGWLRKWYCVTHAKNGAPCMYRRYIAVRTKHAPEAP